jgi:hypothetical protein
MIELSGAVESSALTLLLQFIAGLGRSGRLRVIRQPLAGDIDFAGGTVVDAVCGSDHGLAALDVLCVVPGPVEFSFVAMEPAHEASTLSLAPAVLAERLDSLQEQQLRIGSALRALAARPIRVTPAERSPDDQFTLTRREIELLLAVNGRRTVLDLIGTQHLLVRLGALANLVELGFVEVAEPRVAPALPLADQKFFKSPFSIVRHRPTLRHVAWGVVVLFVVMMGALQLPDIIRQVRGARDTSGVVVTSPSLSTPPDPSVSWPSQPGGPFWTTPDGYHLAPSAQVDPVVVSPPVSARGQDVAVRASFLQLRGTAGSDNYGFVIRDQSPVPRDASNADGQYVVVALDASHHVSARRRDGQRWIELSVTSAAAPANARGQDNVSLTALGNRITLDLDGTRIATVEDPTPSSGGVAFYAAGPETEILINGFTLSFP